ncbi:hypothetical protein D3C71_1507020 [compost metagenome]
MGQRGVGGHHLGAVDIDAFVGFAGDVDVDVLDRVARLVAVDRRVDDGVVQVQAVFLDALVPGLRVAFEAPVELRVGAQGVAEGRLVVGGAAHPAVAHARPFGDGVALLEHLLRGAGVAEELVGVAAVAGVGRPAQLVLGLRSMQGVVERGHGLRRVAERRVGGHVLDALAGIVDLATVAQAGEEFLASERATGLLDVAFGFHGHALSILVVGIATTEELRLRESSAAACHLKLGTAH